MGHLEDPTLTSDLTVARDFDLGMTGPPLSHLDGLHRRRPGRDDRRPRLGASCCSATRGGRRSCSAAPGWPRTGCCARARSGATATPTRCARAQRDADYAYRLAVDPPAGQGAAAVRAGRLDDRPLHRAPHAAARAAVRGDPAARAAGGLEPAARARRQRRSCSGRSPTRRADGRPRPRRSVVVFAQSAVGASMIAFGGLNWALDGAAAPVAAVLRLEPAMAPAGALPSGDAARPPACRRARSASAT